MVSYLLVCPYANMNRAKANASMNKENTKPEVRNKVRLKKLYSIFSHISPSV